MDTLPEYDTGHHRGFANGEWGAIPEHGGVCKDRRLYRSASRGAHKTSRGDGAGIPARRLGQRTNRVAVNSLQDDVIRNAEGA